MVRSSVSAVRLDIVRIIFVAIQMVIIFLMIGMIFLQKGESEDQAPAAQSNRQFTRGSGNLLTQATAVLAALFFANSLFISYLIRQENSPKSLSALAKTQKDDSTAGPTSAQPDMTCSTDADHDSDSPAPDQDGGGTDPNNDSGDVAGTAQDSDTASHQDTTSAPKKGQEPHEIETSSAEYAKSGDKSDDIMSPEES